MTPAPAQTPGEGEWGHMTTRPGSNAAFVCLAVKTGTLELVLFRLLRNLEKQRKKEKGGGEDRPSQPPPRPCA